MKPFLYLFFSAGISLFASGQCLTDFTKLLPEPSIDHTQGFGRSISMYDDYLAIGAPNNDSLGRITGIVHVYQKISDEWKKIAS
ncbi:MAG: FG-GAP repeat protein, partial [Cyclobacteriaceae bacterium]